MRHFSESGVEPICNCPSRIQLHTNRARASASDWAEFLQSPMATKEGKEAFGWAITSFSVCLLAIRLKEACADGVLKG